MKTYITILLVVGAIGCTRSQPTDATSGKLTFEEAYARRVHEETALHIAARLGDRGRIKRLLDEGADVEARTDYGATPLVFATIFATDMQTFEFLVSKGANIRTQENDKSTLLHTAAAHGKQDIAEFLLTQKLDVNAKTEYQSTPLHAAVANARTEVVQLLLDRGAKVDPADVLGATPLHHGVELACVNAVIPGNKYLEVLDLILRMGADVNAKTTQDAPMTSGIPSQIKAGATPLSIALRYAHSERNKDVVALLKKYGATE
ncbi:MAG: ankyrin repeat domain-containing protein [bacterium]